MPLLTLGQKTNPVEGVKPAERPADVISPPPSEPTKVAPCLTDRASLGMLTLRTVADFHGPSTHLDQHQAREVQPRHVNAPGPKPARYTW